MRWITAFIFFVTANCFANGHPVIDLDINYKTVNFTGTSAKAIAINNQIPGPTLHFKEGDFVTINVHNHLDQDTAIHWHGLLVPWQMDGVAHVTQKPIPPGGVFHYQFKLKQAGTYWYHAHASLQEQQGLYGAFIIDPPKQRFKANKDFIIVLSDWSNTNPEQIYANLKKEGDYYGPNFPIQPSLVRFISDYKKAKTATAKQKVWSDYDMMQHMRMSIYDFSDVAYDTFLLNGNPTSRPWIKQVKIGDVVRLRFINAGGSTFFNIKIPNTKMQLIHVQGNDIQPYFVDQLTIAPAETYDVLIKIKKNSPYIIYAESFDKVGKALGALITQPNQVVNYKDVTSFPDPDPVTTMGHDMPGMSMDHSMNHSMDHMMMSMPNTDKYQKLKSPTKTNNPHKPYQIINMKLSGYMDRYIWFLNGLPEYKSKPIMIEPGKRYRIVFENNTMMHHPMHLHGHWFILRNGNGAYDPLLHTIDVPPGATILADFDANENSGAWYFHCHNIFHMKAGMATQMRYTSTPAAEMNQYAHHGVLNASNYATAHPPQWYQATNLELSSDFNNFYEFSFTSLIGPDYNKLQFYTEDAEINNGIVDNADIDIFYWRLISQFWAIKGGVNYFYRPAKTPYWQPGIGIEGVMPYFINTNLRAYLHSGSTKLDLQLWRDTQITNNFFIQVRLRGIAATKTVTNAAIGSGLNELQFTVRPYYRITPGISLFAEYQHTQNYGTTKNILQSLGELDKENTVTAGVSVLF